jgi:hypothetical protein
MLFGGFELLVFTFFFSFLLLEFFSWKESSPLIFALKAAPSVTFF